MVVETHVVPSEEATSEALAIGASARTSAVAVSETLQNFLAIFLPPCRRPGCLFVEAPGFASPPHDGFALVELPYKRNIGAWTVSEYGESRYKNRNHCARK